MRAYFLVKNRKPRLLPQWARAKMGETYFSVNYVAPGGRVNDANPLPQWTNDIAQAKAFPTPDFAMPYLVRRSTGEPYQSMRGVQLVYMRVPDPPDTY